MADSESVRDKLKNKGYKFTPQRRDILDVMLENDDKHLSTEEIYMMVKEKCPEIGLATVYRTLQLLERLGIIHRLNFDDGCSRYEMAEDSEGHQHHHLVCVKCGKVEEVEEDLLEHLEREVEEKKGFIILDHRLKFFGYCKTCAGK